MFLKKGIALIIEVKNGSEYALINQLDYSVTEKKNMLNRNYA